MSRKWWKPWQREAAKPAAAAVKPAHDGAGNPKDGWIKVPEGVLAAAKKKHDAAGRPADTTAGGGSDPFRLPEFPPGVAPKPETEGAKSGMAMDTSITAVNAWAAQSLYAGAFMEGVTFMGYPYLSQVAQRPEFRRVTEVLATEATRKWIKFTSTGTGDKSEKIKELEAEFTRLKVQDNFRMMSEMDGFFGRAHLYLDTGATDQPDELRSPIGDGQNEITKAKFKKGDLKRLQPVEPVWTYPAEYNSNDPLQPDWYTPQRWLVIGKEVHASRLLIFVAREVPDMLKPAYSFGGLSLSQMVQPYVENWLKIRQAVADLVWSFSVSGLATNLSSQLQTDGQALFMRADLFNNLRNNRGLMIVDKETEEFFQFNVPLTTLDALQAQAQEHMASVSSTPVVKLLGIQPAGLNASSQGELECWYDWVEAYQEKMFRERLTRVMHFAEMNIWGDVDPEINFVFEGIRSDDPVQEAQTRKLDAETDDVRIASGVISPEEARAKIAGDEASGYAGIDVSAVPVLPADPSLEGIDITGTQRPEKQESIVDRGEGELKEAAE